MATSIDLFGSLITYIDSGQPLTNQTRLSAYLISQTSATAKVVIDFFTAIVDGLFSLSIIPTATQNSFNTWVNQTPVNDIKRIFLLLKSLILNDRNIKINDLNTFISLLDITISLNDKIILNLNKFSTIYLSNIVDPDVKSVIMEEVNKLIKKYTVLNINLNNEKIETLNRIAAI